MKMKAFTITMVFYAFFFIIYFVLKYIIDSLWNNVRHDIPFLIVSCLKILLHLYIIALFVMIITSFKNAFDILYNYIKIENIDYEQFSFNDMRNIVNVNDNTNIFFDRKTLSVILSSILCIILFVLIFFLCAVTLDAIQSNLSYVYILLAWTLLFSGFFYLNYNRFFNVCSREIDIYILLIILYIIALLFNKNIFDNLILLYQPFDDLYRNRKMQSLLYDCMEKYSNYLIDWALLQGVILSILIHNDFGGRRQRNYEQKVNDKKKQFNSINKLIDILEEIDNEQIFLDYCQKAKMGLAGKNIAYKDKIINYHNQIESIYLEVKNTEFAWMLDIFPIDLLYNQTFIIEYLENIEKPKFKICSICKCAFFDNSNETTCKNCKNTKSIKILQ